MRKGTGRFSCENARSLKNTGERKTYENSNKSRNIDACLQHGFAEYTPRRGALPRNERPENAGNEVILISSGAIGMGVGKLGLKKRPTDIPTKQAAAAVGQCELMYIYDKLFGEYNHTVAQILLTKRTWRTRRAAKTSKIPCSACLSSVRYPS